LTIDAIIAPIFNHLWDAPVMARKREHPKASKPAVQEPILQEFMRGLG
jgi:hypothetical protein